VLGEGFVLQALIELWIKRSHAGKTIIVHRAVPTLVMLTNNFLLNKAFIWPLLKLTIPNAPKSN